MKTNFKKTGGLKWPTLLICVLLLISEGINFAAKGACPFSKNSPALLIKTCQSTQDTTVKSERGLTTGKPLDSVSNKKLAFSPPMGWNSWNWFGKDHINETAVKQVINAMVSEGLRDIGYEYIVVDGGWRDTTLGSGGELLVDHKAFPSGIKALADYAHSKGLKFGLHIAAGTADCGGDKVGGYGHEKVQTKQLADWGVDFIKLDKCIMEGGWNEKLLKAVYTKWSHLLKDCGRDIVLSASAYQFRKWNPEVCQMSRTTYDIGAKANVGASFDYTKKTRNFLSVMAVAEINNNAAKYAGNGYWNNPDMLPMGAQGLSVPEQRATFALWCIMSAPLFLGNDPRHMTTAEKKIIRNRTAIKIDQDPTEQGERIFKTGYSEIWAKRLKDGSVGVLLLNRNPYDSEQITLNMEQIGLSGEVSIKNIFADEYLGLFNSRFSRLIKPQSGLFLLISKVTQ